MSAFSQALQASIAPTGATCLTGRILAGLPKDDAAELAVALRDLEVPASAIARALTSMGQRITDGAVQRHRRRECRCEVR